MSISTRAYVIISAVCLLGVLLLSGTGVLAQDSRLVWSQVGGTSATVEFKNVFMVNEHTAWAVGSDKSPGRMGGIAYKLTNSEGVWRADAAVAFTEVPNAIVVLPSGKAWIVGDNGLLAQLGPDGSVQEQASPAPDANLLTLQMFGNGEEGWAGGYLPGNEQFPQGQLLMLHYLNGRWAVDESFAGTGQVTSLHFSGSTGYAVTSNGQIWRYNRGWTWESVPAPCGESIPGCYGYFSGVRALEGGEAWAVGSRVSICGICVSRPYALQRTGGTWRQVLPDQGLSGSPQFHPQTEYVLRGVSFMGSLGIAVGWHTQNAGQLDRFRVPMVISYRNGRWHYESIPMPAGELNSVSLLDATRGLAVGNNGIVLSYGYGVQPVQPTPTATAVVASPTPSAEQSPTPTPPQNPATRVSDPRDPTVTYFPPVGHTLRGVFREYWLRNGGLTQFGFPITEEFEEISPTDGKIYTVQYFERARFEQHPENRPPYHVLLGLLGRTITAYRQDEAPFRPAEPRTTPGGIYFKETGHNMAPEFADYWRAHGGLPVYGYPISEPFNEVSPSNGRIYLVQYFERNRFEYHPELQEPFRVSLGLLGVQVLRARGWLP